ncbi:MAG: hypothetical protein CMJ59_06590 [Planctomycetaceae bacterium]|nr:hypothetical protein [Planctomycetaceae bacterium]
MTRGNRRDRPLATTCCQPTASQRGPGDGRTWRHRSPRRSDSNPFSVRWMDPGKVPFVPLPGVRLETLLDQLARNRGWGQIVGPHGSGKTTLINQLGYQLASQPLPVVKIVLDGRRLRGGFAQAIRAAWNTGAQILVDGFEQWPAAARWGLRAVCRRRGCGLLVTAHRDMGLPLLAETKPSLVLTHSIVQKLLERYPAGLISREDVRGCFRQQRGNLRETLFALYDLFERRRPDRDGASAVVSEIAACG